MVYDIYHAQQACEDTAPIFEVKDEIRVVHISGEKDGTRPFLDEKSAATFRPYLDALRACGYDGEIGVEAIVGDALKGIPESLKILKTM